MTEFTTKYRKYEKIRKIDGVQPYQLYRGKKIEPSLKTRSKNFERLKRTKIYNTSYQRTSFTFLEDFSLFAVGAN